MSLHYEKFNGIGISIEQDDDASNPRENDNLGTMICFHRRYKLGDEHDLDKNQFHSWAELYDYIKKVLHGYIILPLYLLDHSGLMLSTGRYCSDPQGWDTSMVGYIYITAEKIRQEMCRPKYRKNQINPILKPIKHISKNDHTRVMTHLKEEVEEYSHYLNGDCYGFMLYEIDEESSADDPGDILDSCWGFYNYDDCLAEAKAESKYWRKKLDQHQHRLEQLQLVTTA